jgi:predicted P-loop ATPase
MTDFAYSLISLSVTNDFANSINNDYQQLLRGHDNINNHKLRVPYICSILHHDEPQLNFDIEDWRG